MITETQFSAISSKDISRKEKIRENDPRFQDIFTALTAALQMASPQAANSLSNGPGQNGNSHVGNVVAPHKSGQNQKGLSHSRIDQNNSKKADRSFSDNLQNAAENSKTNNYKKDGVNEVQTSRTEQASPVSSKNVEERRPQTELNDDSDDATAQSQDDNPVSQENKKTDDSVNKESESDLNKLAKALQSLPNDASNAQSASPDAATPQQFLSLLNEQGGKIEDLLVQAGMSEADAKNLLSKIETQIENSIQAGEALKGEMRNNEVKLPTDATANKSATGKETISLDKTVKFSADNLAKILQNQNGGANTGDKTESLPNMPSKLEGKDSVAEIPTATDKGKDSVVDILPVTDKGMEVFERSFSSNQDNMSSLHTSNSQDGEDNALSKIKELSDLPASASGSAKAAANTPAHNLSADLSPKSISELKQMLAPQEVVNRGTIEKPVVNQIIEKFSLQGTGQQNEINIKLEPPNLGTVRINIVSDGDNVNTTLITDNHAVKQTIESNLAQLRDAMADQGLKVQSFTVLVGGHQGQRGQNHQQQQGAANFPGTPFQEGANRQGNGEPVLTGRKTFYDKSQSISVFA